MTTTVKPVKSKKASEGKKPAKKRGRQAFEYKETSKAKTYRNRPVASSTPNKYPLTIRNFVYTSSFGREINLSLSAVATCGCYREPVFPSVVVHCDNPLITINLFASGNMVVSGAKRPADAFNVMYQTAYRMSLAFNTHFSVINGRPENVVASAAIGDRLNLDLLWADNKANADFAPDRIKCVFLYPKGGALKPVALVFETGKMVVTGAETPEELKTFYESIEWHKYIVGKEYRQIEESEKKTRKKIEKKKKVPTKKEIDADRKHPMVAWILDGTPAPEGSDDDEEAEERTTATVKEPDKKESSEDVHMKEVLTGTASHLFSGHVDEHELDMDMDTHGFTSDLEKALYDAFGISRDDEVDDGAATEGGLENV